MAKKRARPSKKKGGGRGSCSKDYINETPDEILLMILCLLPAKDAIVLSSVSTRLRFLWTTFSQLKFDGTKMLRKMAMDRNLSASELARYVKHVNHVIQNHKASVIRDFRIRFDLDYEYGGVIDEWLRVAVNKDVEILELDLSPIGSNVRNRHENYDFPTRLLNTKHGSRVRWLSPNTARVEISYLKKLSLKSVNLRNATLQEILTNSPDLENLSIHGAGKLKNVYVGGGSLSLKHLEIVDCFDVRSIYLYEFDLVSFGYKGPAINLAIDDLPKLKKLNIGEGIAWLENSLFSKISSCLSCLQVLSFNIDYPEEILKLNSIPELPNVKNLRLTIGARKDYSLLEFTKFAKTCPNLETLSIELLWVSPVKLRRNVRHVASQPLEHLKNLEIRGYYGRMSDVELVVYVIENAAGLKRILVDPRHQGSMGTIAGNYFSKMEKATRSFAKRQLKSLIPGGVKLIVL